MHRERRAAPGAGALGGHGATMQFDEPSHNVEHVPEKGGGNAPSGVADRHHDERAFIAHGDANLAARRELHRVREEVQDDLLQPCRV